MTGSLVLPLDGSSSPVEDRRILRVAVVAVVAALLGLMVAQLVVPTVAGPAAPAAQDAAAVPAAKVDRPGTAAAEPTLGEGVIERATHQVVATPGAPGSFEVHDPSYVSRFDRSGFSYTPTGSHDAFELSLSSLARGSDPIAVQRGGWSARENVVERPAAAGMTERVTARSGEVEWDLVLSSAPAGRGPLVVGAALEGVVGPPARVQTADGPAWDLGLTGGETVRVDEMIVKDAHGAELHRALPTIEGDRIELVVPDRVLTDAAYPLLVDPTVSGPTEVSPSGWDPSVAFDGTHYLVVYTTAAGIAGTRVQTNGSAGAPFVISSAFGHSPDVAWNGSEFLVVWSRPVSQGIDSFSAITARRVSPSGSLLGSSIDVSYFQGYGIHDRAPAVAASITPCARPPFCFNPEWLVVWERSQGSNHDIYGARVLVDGSNENPNGFPIYASSLEDSAPDVAYNGSTFLVVWQTPVSPSGASVVMAQQLQQSGNYNGGLLGTPIGLSSESCCFAIGNHREPTVASDGSNFFAVWQRRDADGVRDIYGLRLDRDARALDRQFVVHEGGAVDSTLPVVAYSNGRYLVVWQEDYAGRSAIAAAFVSKEGVAGSASPVDARTDRRLSSPAVGAGPSNRWGIEYEVTDELTSIVHRGAK